MTLNASPSKKIRRVCVLSSMEVRTFTEYGESPKCGRGNHLHVGADRAAQLVRDGDCRWVGRDASRIRYVEPKTWSNVVGVTGHTTQQMIEGGLRI